MLRHVALVRSCARSIVPQFLSYALYSRHGQEQFGLSQYGGTKQGLGLDDVRDVIVLLPPMPEQLQICEFLNEYLEHLACSVSAARREIELLREYHTRLIADVVTGVQAIIHRAVTRGLDPDVPLKPSGVEWLGDVPEHWEVRPVRRLITFIAG